MTLGGIIVMALAWGIIISIVVYCFVRLFEEEKNMEK